MKVILFFIFSLIVSRSFAQNKNDDLLILVNGEKYKSLEIATIKRLKANTVDFYDHASRKSESFKGVPLIPLLTSILPEQLKKTVEVELISSNGYKTYFPIESFYKVDAILSYVALNGKFERYSWKEKLMVPLGPYYLVWDFKSIGKEDKNQYSSVYQIKQINLITNIVDFEVHDIKNNETIILGFRTYKKYCLSCHAVGPWGGEIGADLIKMKTLESRGADFITKYALNPQSINSQTKMLPLPKYKNRVAMAQGLVEFLNFASNPDQYIKSKKIESDKIRYDSFKTIVNEMRNGIKN